MCNFLNLLIYSLIIIFNIAALLTIVYLWKDNKPMLHNGFQDEIETGGEIEKKYLQNGECEVKKATVKEHHFTTFRLTHLF
ncbi:hypothetical protein D7V86_22725 [bacterium D16-51]|nr:hypothetical protein D7V96_22675 [bacterium D16-59]RKI54905.1 hypothetical protein D7V86_22725 [bacterium D16-51]